MGRPPAQDTGVARRGLLLRWGLPRDPSASNNLSGFLVSAVTTVLAVRGLLAASGYPQVGGGGLHIAHVLWGGLLMALAFVFLLSFSGPVVRPVGALLGGVGFGLFVDESGKFVTSSNDYFYEPTAALIYGVVVTLVLTIEALTGRTAHHPSEYLAGAADRAVSGLAGGFTPHARTTAQDLLDKAGDLPGVEPMRGVLAAIEDDPDELPNPIAATSRFVVRLVHAVVRTRWVPRVTVAVLTLAALGAAARGLTHWRGGASDPTWVLVGLLVSAAVSLGLAVLGLVAARASAVAAFEWFRRSVLVSLLVTQIFLFRIEVWAATWGLAVDLVVLGVVLAHLSVLEERAAKRA